MTETKKHPAWESLPCGKGTILRLGNTDYGIKPYEFGYVVGRIRKHKVGYIIQSDSANYPSTLGQVLFIISTRASTTLTGQLAKDFETALKAQLEILRIAEELNERMEQQYDLKAKPTKRKSGT